MRRLVRMYRKGRSADGWRCGSCAALFLFDGPNEAGSRWTYAAFLLHLRHRHGRLRVKDWEVCKLPKGTYHHYWVEPWRP